MDTTSPQGEGPAVTRVAVGLDRRSYDIVIGGGLLPAASRYIGPHLNRPRTAVITDERIAALHLDTLLGSLRDAGIEAEAVVVPDGEATKSLDWAGRVADGLLDAGIERRDVVIALGGGVVGDLAGFAAAIVHRGIDFVQVPTTLLAQVDSSVGGKTGVNARHGKNLIGAFHQPVLVLADTDVLATLPNREMRAGYAEIVKYGLIDDRPFFDWLERNRADILAGGPTLADAVATSCRAKARVVEADEREAGRRGLLNLGHTFAHAFEAALGYGGKLLHGEAVSLGMVQAFELSVRLGHCSRTDADAVRSHLDASGLPTRLADHAQALPSARDLVSLMAHDKKVVAGAKTFVLARSIGDAFLTRDVPDDTVVTLLEDALTQ